MAEVWHVEDEDRELWGPSVDVCAWCGDCECDGMVIVLVRTIVGRRRRKNTNACTMPGRSIAV